MRYRHTRGKHEAQAIITIDLTRTKRSLHMIIVLAVSMLFLGSFTYSAASADRQIKPHTAEPHRIVLTPPYLYTTNHPIIPQLEEGVQTNPLMLVDEEVASEYLVSNAGPEEEPIEEPVEEIPVEPPEPEWILEEHYGEDTITTPDGHTLTRYDLPDVYHPGIDFSSVQTYMAYSVIKDRSSAAYKIAWHENAYTDDLGFRRFDTDESYFTINDQEDDYMIALGTYYKPKGTCGDRWLIVTDNGSYTAITGDEKSDLHTDENHQYKPYGKYANVIEFLIDRPSLCKEVKRAGSVTCLDKFSGTILYMYRID